MLIQELCEKYQAWADARYTTTATPKDIALAIKNLMSVCPDGPAESFRRPQLKAVQAYMMGTGISPRTVNNRTMWIRSMFNWGAEQGLIADLQCWELSRVKKLPAPTHTVRSVSWERVSETMAVAPLKIATMIELMWHTGMRSGELCAMRKSDIDRSGRAWMYRPRRHKTQHFGLSREIPLGPMAQSVLATWLPRVKDDVLFTAARGGGPMNPMGLWEAIRNVNRKHGVPHWHPHQIRHATATRLNKALGIEAAQAVLGHTTPKTTRIYIDPDNESASSIAEKFG